MLEPTIDVDLEPQDLVQALRADVRAGLTSNPKTLPPKWFYDDRGSELFGQITQLPEYYPTRTERALLEQYAGEIAAIAAPEVLIELGSGNASKTRVLLDALGESLKLYVPQDVSAGTLVDSAHDLAAAYPSLQIHGIVSDFTNTLHRLPTGQRRMVAFLGGTIGNLVPDERAEFLAEIAEALQPGEHALIGAGLVVPESVVVPAYADSAGVTAEFNRNVLHVINRELDADFEPDKFNHVALWNSDAEWIEMHLEATEAMQVRVGELGLDLSLEAGERIRTEVSAKFQPDGLTLELENAGFSVVQSWRDPLARFALTLAAVNTRR